MKGFKPYPRALSDPSPEQATWLYSGNLPGVAWRLGEPAGADARENVAELMLQTPFTVLSYS